MSFDYALLLAIISSFIAIFLTYQIVNMFKVRNYFSDRGVKYDGGIPILGSLYQAYIGFDTLAATLQKLYQRFPNERLIGFYKYPSQPTYLIRDPQLIESILITDFECFSKHDGQYVKSVCPAMQPLPNQLYDDKWCEVRTNLCQLFTGGKMQVLYASILRTVEGHVKAMQDEFAKLKDGSSHGMELNAVNLCQNSVMDTISFCVFGVGLSSFRFRQLTELAARAHYPIGAAIDQISDWFQRHFRPEQQHQDYCNLIRVNLEDRKLYSSDQRDMMYLLRLMRDGQLKDVAESEEHSALGFAMVDEGQTPHQPANLERECSKKKELNFNERQPKPILFCRLDG